MSEYKPITGELRNSMTYEITTAPDGVSTASLDTSAFCDLCDAIDSVHAALEAENERLREQDNWGLVLPKDMDGEPVRIGDVLCWPDGEDEPFEVVGIGLNGTVYYMYDDSCEWTKAGTKRHHQPDTWERIIEDAIRGDGGSYGCLEERFDAMVPALVARCKALAGDAE